MAGFHPDPPLGSVQIYPCSSLPATKLTNWVAKRCSRSWRAIFGCCRLQLLLFLRSRNSHSTHQRVSPNQSCNYLPVAHFPSNQEHHWRRRFIHNLNSSSNQLLICSRDRQKYQPSYGYRRSIQRKHSHERKRKSVGGNVQFDCFHRQFWRWHFKPGCVCLNDRWHIRFFEAECWGKSPQFQQ